MTLPTYYVPHGGGPCFFLNPDGSCPLMWASMRDHLAAILPSLPERPKAILIVSGHWEEADFTVHSGARPELLFDYYGFPEHTYRLRWDAPGAPALADRAAALLGDAGFATGREAARGWDHGVFVPMMVVDPAADIPTAQLSLRHDLDPAAHIAAGRALAPLREEGVLIVGSGMSFHNMRARDGSAQARADMFDAALAAAATDADPARRRERIAAWADLPEARYAHPREEHLLPLMVALGAGGDDPATHAFRDHVIGWTVSAFRFG
ncbi:DODA-type extradiol aromatic ring-opening family dioxygenase [Sphingomonas nostoxanthinifaciens]|uniref:DODA-type extradiol aromatic ring-opening family dioxygenase n=1 Tax=Sphingomonas nostoxanthinifaciens TaxID=2872652 RepID=UPI001CC20347|nr:class III extradiol ring-cleavage dioxygenase [Sphingomonas nostoxanthinifaciens]UAK24731.1 dioxygenase [Sphingomonas nostoxanthinifaciens]